MNWSRVEKRIGISGFRRLQQARVGIVGLGSGGGFVALNLAMSGVGQFTLVDGDVLETGNVVRHVCDLRAVGRPKVAAVAELILNRNADARVKTFQTQIEDCHEALNDLDLLVVGVDGERVKFDINAACLKRNLAAIYAGVYERGVGGDVVWIRPREGPCYACWAAQLREDVAEQAGGPELDYGLSLEEQELRAEPGLWLDVVRVAAAQTYFALEVLLQGEEAEASLRANTLLLANGDIEIFEGEITAAQNSVWINIERHQDCFVCGEAFQNEDEAGFPVSLEDLGATISEDNDNLD